jgi:hypothetical protein
MTYAPNVWLWIVAALLALMGIIVENLTITPAIPRAAAFWLVLLAWLILALATVFSKRRPA